MSDVSRLSKLNRLEIKLEQQLLKVRRLKQRELGECWHELIYIPYYGASHCSACKKREGEFTSRDNEPYKQKIRRREVCA